MQVPMHMPIVLVSDSATILCNFYFILHAQCAQSLLYFTAILKSALVILVLCYTQLYNCKMAGQEALTLYFYLMF